MSRVTSLILFVVILYSFLFWNPSLCQDHLPLQQGLKTPFTLSPGSNANFYVNVSSSPRVLHFTAQCSLTPDLTTFTYDFAIVVSNQTTPNVAEVQTNLFSETNLFVREVLVPSQILSLGLWNVTVINNSTASLFCMALGSLSEEILVPYNVEWNLTLTPPSWTFLRFSVPPNQLLSMIAFQTQIDEDTYRMGLKLSRNGYPNLNSAIILPDTTAPTGVSLSISELVTEPMPETVNWIAAVFLISTGLPPVNRLTYRTLFTLNTPQTLSSNVPSQFVLNPLRSYFFNLQVTEPNTTLFITFSSETGGLTPLINSEHYPTYLDNIRNAFTQYSDNYTTLTYFYEGVIPSSQVLPGVWRLRLNNFFNYPVNFSILVDIAHEFLLFVDAPPVSRLIDSTSSCVCQIHPPHNLRTLAIVLESRLDLDFLLQIGSYPNGFNSFISYELFESISPNGTITKYIVIPREFVRTLDTIYLRILPISRQFQPDNVTITVFEAEDHRLQDISIIGGELEPFNSDFFGVEVATNNTFYWYIRVDSNGGPVTMNVRGNSLPFVQPEQNVLRNEYYELFTPPLILYELLVPPTALVEGTWFLQLTAGDSRIEYTLMSVLVEEYQLVFSDPPMEIELSGYRMIFLRWNVPSLNRPLAIRIQPANVHVITRFNALPFTMNFDENVTYSVINDTLTLVLNQPQAGILYARIEADSFLRFISVQAAPVLSPPPVNPIPVPMTPQSPPPTAPVPVPVTSNNVTTPQTPSTPSGSGISGEGIALILVSILSVAIILILLTIVILQRGVIARMTQPKIGDYQLLDPAK